MNSGWDGLLLLDKPAGRTSHDMVARVRRITGQRKVGHAGTLDPMATGLLPLVLGRATRLVRYLPDSPKEYEGEIVLGLVTASDDVTGELLARHDGPLPDAARVERAARALVGRSPQVPPAVSARKVGGERLYRLARRGRPTLAPAVEVEIWSFDVEPAGGSGRYRFRTRVSPGTYVRSMARDLGERLGCGGTLAALRRTSVGPLTPDPELCWTPETEPDAAGLRSRLIPLDEMPLRPPRLRIEGDADVHRFLHGGAIACLGGAGDEQTVAVSDRAGRLLGIGTRLGGELRPAVVVAPIGSD